jgi:hypothetical protein
MKIKKRSIIKLTVEKSDKKQEQKLQEQFKKVLSYGTRSQAD